MTEPWYMELPFSRLRGKLSQEDYLKLRRFYTTQLALCQALVDGKPLGICKITMSGENPSLDMFHEEEKAVRCISSKGVSKEMSS